MYLSVSPCAFADRDLAQGGAIAVAGDPPSQTRAPPNAMASPPWRDFPPQGFLSPESAEVCVEKLRRHFTEAFEGDAWDRLITASCIMDEWVWTNSAPHDQAADIEILQHQYAHLPGDSAKARATFLEKELQAKKDQIEAGLEHEDCARLGRVLKAEAATQAQKEQRDLMAEHGMSASAAAFVTENQLQRYFRPDGFCPQPKGNEQGKGTETRAKGKDKGKGGVIDISSESDPDDKTSSAGWSTTAVAGSASDGPPVFLLPPEERVRLVSSGAAWATTLYYKAHATWPDAP